MADDVAASQREKAAIHTLEVASTAVRTPKQIW